MSSARVGAFSQRVARMIVQREVAVAHEGDKFQNMKVILSLRLYTAVDFSFPSSSCLELRPKSPFTLLLASLIRKAPHALHLSTLRGCVSPLYHISSLSFTH